MAEENTEAKYRWDEFPYVKTAEDLENYIKYRYGKGKTDKYQNLRAYNHGGFFHYTKLSCIENILKSKSFFWIIRENPMIRKKMLYQIRNISFIFVLVRAIMRICRYGICTQE